MSKRTPQHDRYPIRTVDPGTVEAAGVDPTPIDLMAGDPPRRPRQRGWDGAHRPGKPTQELRHTNTLAPMNGPGFPLPVVRERQASGKVRGGR